MGGGGKGTTTTTQKMEIPPEVMARYNAVNARAETTAQQPFQAYSNYANAFVAPLTPTQQAGIQNTNIMAGAAQPFYNAGAALTASGAQNINPQALNVGQYYNPFTQAVAAPTLQALQQQQAVERSSLVNPQSARSFGGDRSGLVAANMARQQDLATAQAMAPIYQNAFTQALQTAGQQQQVGLAAEQANAARALQAGAQFGQLGTGAQQAGLAGAQAQLGAGQAEQQTQQAGLQALYNQYQQQQAYPFQIAQFLANIAMGTGSLSGNTTMGTQQGGGGFFSDKRLKENIEKVGKTNDGQNIYRYNYKGDPRTQIGLLAQEVAHEHPEAVGRRDGYLTVDYRDATNDAVRHHKDTGGAETGTDAYNINAPSAMLSPMQKGLGAIMMPAMVGGGGLPIQAGAINPADQGLLAPKATGYSLGSKEGAQAQLASLRGADMSKSQSGQEYFDYQTKALEDFLKNYDTSSQGGLVSGPGAFARGGYADAGYVNPALAFYGADKKGGLGAGGIYGTPMQLGQYQLTKAPELKYHQQKSGIEQANQIANVTSKGAEAWGARPDFLRSAADVAARQQAAQALDAQQKGIIADAQKRGLIPANPPLDPNKRADIPSDVEVVARGGLIGRHHYSGEDGESYVKPDKGLYGTGEDDQGALGKTLGQKLEQYKMATPQNMPTPQQGPSGVQQAGQAVGLLSSGKKAFDYGSKMLGKLGGDAAGAAGSTVTPIASSTGYVLPAAGEAAGAAAGAGELAGLGAGAAGAAEGAGLLGTLGTAAGAVGEGISAVLPFLAFLSDRRMKHDIEQVGKLHDGQPVYRFKYNGDDKTHMGLIAQNVEKHHPEAVKGLGGAKMVDYAKATDEAAGLAPRQHFQQAGPVVDVDEEPSSKGDRLNFAPDRPPVPPRDIPAKPRVEAEAPRSSSFMDTIGEATSGLGKLASGFGDTLKSKDETFWVPAIAGLGSMLASRNPTLLGAIGEGLVGGTGAYSNIQKLNTEQFMKRLEMSKGRFKGPTLVNGVDMYLDTLMGDYVPEAEMGRRQNTFITGKEGQGLPTSPVGGTAERPAATATAPTTPPAVGTAKQVIAETAPKVEPRPIAQAKPPETPPAVTPPEQKPQEQPAEGQTSKLKLMEEARNNPALFMGLPFQRRPEYLDKEAARLEEEAKKFERQSEAYSINSEKTKGAEERTRLENASKKFADLARDKRAEADRRKAESDAAVEAAIGLRMKTEEARTTKNVEREFSEEIEPLTGATIQMPPGQKLPRPVAPEPTEEQKKAPKEATVDQKTGQLMLARPVAPANGGRLIPNIPEGAKLTKMSKEAENQMELDQQFQKDFLEKAPSVSQARQRYMGLVNAFKLFESGSTEGTRAGWAAVAQTFGFPDIARGLASGDPAAVQWTEKIGPNLVLETLKAATPRFAQSEFMTLQEKGTPEPNKLPQTNFQMVKEGLATLNRTEAFMQAWQRASQEEGWRSPSAYYAEWSRVNPLEKFERAAERQMGNFAGMQLPKAEDWTPGAVYVVPPRLAPEQNKFFAERGLKAGDTFQYGGPDAPRELVIRPIPKQQLYSMPAMGR